MRSKDTTEPAIPARKDVHLDLCLERPVESGVATGLDALTLEYDALPEVNLDDVDLGVTFLGRRLAAPLMVGAMTGGSPRAAEINARLARAAARVGVGMALGSQRAMIVDESLTSTYALRDAAPDLPLLLGNIGAVQLNYGVGLGDIERALHAVGADGVNFHLNPLQEAIQPEGNTRFAGLERRLGEIINALGLPVLVKEVGAGISGRTARKLARLPLAGVEVAGVGGTSWARVESYRAPEGSAARAAGIALSGFGVPTAVSLRACRRELPPSCAVVASGGLRSGMDVAIALALGADLTALAQPLVKAAAESEDAVVQLLERLIYELKVICFCTGACDVAALRQVRVLGGGYEDVCTREKD
ncbi:MAG: type 2 isopentenyl-diphosphate Delta-isomerase [Deltaproteobacteria bacterium]|nr:type 2 isopentenyl-diphosphate Delta-isomerase [Deltaproteobacteria bacterium]